MLCKRLASVHTCVACTAAVPAEVVARQSSWAFAMSPVERRVEESMADPEEEEERDEIRLRRGVGRDEGGKAKRHMDEIDRGGGGHERGGSRRVHT